ncbi:hypothetical protein [Arsenicibacter rosenii]|uniref:Lipoprotein n=1 Tax=Arsenicibacter rosenii TaxID=1750698 RepID=A0A1S2VKA9_9BACT|nr:hypothetical protein [Arsenicibacter rosenii]OIN58830.1 hypothetical protein BLX24_11395 [Arsenicibacter rosenii]
MKRYLLCLSLAVLAGGSVLISCQSKKESTQVADSTATAEPAAEVTVSGRLDSLGVTTEGHWRGISLGDSLARVQKIEKAELFETEPDHVGYSVEFPNLESMDVLYYHKGQPLVSGIVVDLYLNTAQSVKAYSSDLTGYFTARYGKPATEDGMTVWTTPKQEKIKLKDVSTGKDFGLKIRIGETPKPKTNA